MLYKVKKAKSNEDCWIVSYSWLEDCLGVMTKSHKKKRLSEKGYTLKRTLDRISQTLDAQTKYRVSFEEGVRAGNDLVGNRESPWNVYNLPLKDDRKLGLHHIFLDQTGFEYKVDCVRRNECGQTIWEKYTIYVFRTLPPKTRI